MIISMVGWATNPKVKEICRKALKGGAISALFNLFMGRCTFFAIVFVIVGIYGWFHGRDLTAYALFVTAVQGLLVLHSWKEDVAEENQIQAESTTTTTATVVVNTPQASANSKDPACSNQQ